MVETAGCRVGGGEGCGVGRGAGWRRDCWLQSTGKGVGREGEMVGRSAGWRRNFQLGREGETVEEGVRGEATSPLP